MRQWPLSGTSKQVADCDGVTLNREHNDRQSATPHPDGTINLTPRQLEVLELAASGLRYKNIAVRLGISVRTVQDNFRAMRDRTGTKTRDELIASAAEAGLLGSNNGVSPEHSRVNQNPHRGSPERHIKSQRTDHQPHVEREVLRTDQIGTPAPPEIHSNRQVRSKNSGAAEILKISPTDSDLLQKIADLIQEIRSRTRIRQGEAASTQAALDALRQLAAERDGLDGVERALIDIARHHGASWARIGSALGMRSAQAAQQRRKRLR